MAKMPILEKKSYHLTIYHSFGLLPFGRSFVFINFINHIINFFLLTILLNVNFSQLKTITFTPELAFILFFLRNTIVFCYIQDNYYASPWWNNMFAKMQLFILEKILFRFINKTLVVSLPLKDKYSKYPNVIYFPPPANIRLFLNYRGKKKNKLPSDLTNFHHPLIGLIGTISEWKLDINLLNEIIDKYSSATFVFIGLMRIKNFLAKRTLFSKANVKYLGCRTIKDLPIYISQFDICIMPYNVNNYGNYAYPVKILEYLSLGKPVVTTAIPSIKYLSDQDLIYWSKNNREFINNIKKALKEKCDRTLIRRRVEEAKRNDWNIRIKEFIKIAEYE